MTERHEFATPSWYDAFRDLLAAKLERTENLLGERRVTFQEFWTDLPPDGRGSGWRLTVESGHMVGFEVLDEVHPDTDCGLMVDGPASRELARMRHDDPRHDAIKKELEAQGKVRLEGDLVTLGLIGQMLDGLHDEVSAITA